MSPAVDTRLRGITTTLTVLGAIFLGGNALPAQNPAPPPDEPPEAGDLGPSEITITEPGRATAEADGTPGDAPGTAPAPEDANLDDPAAELFVHANHAYGEGDYGRAVTYYRKLLERGRDGGRLHYNLGNALLRRGDLGAAIAAYRRSLARRPRDQDVLANLEFARRSTQDALEPPSPSPLAATLFFWHYRLSRRELAATVLAVNVLFWGLWGLVRLRRPASEMLHAATVLAFLVLLALGGSLAVRWLVPQRVAVVLPAEIVALSGPGAGAVERFQLHAGAELTVEDRRDGWVRIALPTGQQGWVEAEDVAVVEW